MSQTLLKENTNPLTIPEVFGTLGKLAEIKGAGSKEKRLALLGSLINRTTPLETEYLSRMLLGEMRIGVVEGVLLDAIAEASGVSRQLVRRAHMLHGDIGDVARIALTEGDVALENVGLRLFVPVKPMLAEMGEKIPLRLYLFDLLQSGGNTMIDLPYTERWKVLSSLVPNESLAPRIVTRDPQVVENFMQSALKEGHEGLMAKSLTSDYSPGARGKKWFKIKPADRLDVVIVAADWGSGRRVGWLSNYHLAVRDDETGEYLVVGKTFKGLTDAEFDMITKRLQALKTRESKWTVHVKPEIVVEIAHNEVQKSPRYKSGFALRFARIAKFRDDKAPEDADTIQRLRKLYEKQFESKGRLLKEVP